MKLLITGCAKSGTTLLTRLMTAYEMSVCLEDEMSIESFVQSSFNCAKRNCNTILSSGIFTQEKSQWSSSMVSDWKKQLALLSSHKVSVLHIVRDKEAVLRSDNGWVTPQRYEAVKWQTKELAAFINLQVQYEELCADPDKVQKQVERELGLPAAKNKWSEYHKWYVPTEEEIQTGIYAVRPIG